MIAYQQCQRTRFFFLTFESVWEGGCVLHGKGVLPHSPRSHARVDSERKRWNLEHVVLDLFSPIQTSKIQWLFVSCRGSRSPNSPFALSRLTKPHSCCRGQAQSQRPLLAARLPPCAARARTLNSSPADDGRCSFFRQSWRLAATCTRHRPSEADITRERKLLAARHPHVRLLWNLTGSLMELGRDSCAHGSIRRPWVDQEG